jgi:hypothetical protein
MSAGPLLPAPPERTWLPVTEALAVLERSLAREAELSEIGAFGAHADLTGCLAMQERAVAHRDRPAAVPSRVVVVGGLPRTGTTVLHRIVAEHLGASVPTSCEVANPLFAFDDPPTRRETVEAVDARLALVRELAPNILAMHPMTTGGAEECTSILHSSLRSIQLLLMYHAPDYHDWYETQDLGDTYRYWARQLALIATGRGTTSPLATKSPLHFTGYASLLEVVPQARLVQIRRAVAPWFESYLNLALASRRAAYARVDVVRFAEEWTTRFPRLLDLAAARYPGDDRRILTVDYDRLCRTPAETVTEIAGWLGWPPATGVARVDEVFARLRAEHGAYPRLRLADVGLTARRVRQAFAAHLDGPFLKP